MKFILTWTLALLLSAIAWSGVYCLAIWLLFTAMVTA
jgi:hypothetical protein